MDQKVKQDTVAKEAYRKVISDLALCEERYEGLLASMPGSDAALVTAATAALRSEMQQRRQLEAELLGAVEAERQRIGQDLHDDLCQRLGATAMMTSAIGIRIAPQDSQAAAELEKIAKMTSDSIEACRLLARGLHPFTLAEKGLPAALDELAERMPSGVRVQWPRGKRIVLPPNVALQLYRITEEAVGNSIRHSEAKQMTVKLEALPEHIVLIIEDDGKGFKKSATPRGMGLRNMEYRANTIGATFTIGPRKSGGTRIVCELPRPKA